MIVFIYRMAAIAAFVASVAAFLDGDETAGTVLIFGVIFISILAEVTKIADKKD